MRADRSPRKKTVKIDDVHAVCNVRGFQLNLQRPKFLAIELRSRGEIQRKLGSTRPRSRFTRDTTCVPNCAISDGTFVLSPRSAGNPLSPRPQSFRWSCETAVRRHTSKEFRQARRPRAVCLGLEPRSSKKLLGHTGHLNKRGQVAEFIQSTTGRTIGPIASRLRWVSITLSRGRMNRLPERATILVSLSVVHEPFYALI